MMKKILSLVLLFVLLCSGTALAEKRLPLVRQGPRPKVAVLYLNQSEAAYHKSVDKTILENLNEELMYLSVDVVDSRPFMQRLKKNGVADFAMAERRDLTEVFHGSNVDYVICVQVDPFYRKATTSVFSKGVKMTASVPFRMIDLKNDRFIYNGKFQATDGKSKMIGATGNRSVSLKVLRLVNKQINEVLNEKLAE